MKNLKPSKNKPHIAIISDMHAYIFFDILQHTEVLLSIFKDSKAKNSRSSSHLEVEIFLLQHIVWYQQNHQTPQKKLRLNGTFERFG